MAPRQHAPVASFWSKLSRPVVAELLLVVVLASGCLAATSLAARPSEQSVHALDAVNGTWIPVRRPTVPTWGTGPLFVDRVRDRLVRLHWHGEMWALPLEPGGEWTKVREAGGGPIGYIDWGSAYDADGDRIIAFGGRKLGADPYHGQLWQLPLEPGSDWLPLAAEGTPPPAAGYYCGAYDSANRRVLFFGGYNGSYVGKVWALNLHPAPSWEELIPQNPIAWPYLRQAAVYDPIRHRVLLMVVDPAAYGYRLLELRLEPEPTWADVFPYTLEWAGTQDNGNPSLAYDAIHDHLLVYIITDDYAYTSDLYSYDLSEVPPGFSYLPSNPMLPRAGSGTPTSLAVAFDEKRNRILTHGGRHSNTWALPLDVASSWQPLAAWSLRRTRPALFYDAEADRTIMTSGLIQKYFDDLNYRFVVRGSSLSWELNAASDMQWVVSQIPSMSMENQRPVYVASAAEALLIGGTVPQLVDCDHPGVVSPPVDQVWALDLETPTSPQSRPTIGLGAGASAVLDPLRQRIISYGGARYAYSCDHVIVTDISYLGALRSLSLAAPAAWQELPSIAGAPDPRAWHGSHYDASRDRMLVFGGGKSDTPALNELWELVLSEPMRWERVEAPGEVPPAERFPLTILDPVRERLLVFADRSGAWALPLHGERSWSRLTPAGPVPDLRETAAVSYDSRRDRVVFYGDQDWTLSFGDPMHEIRALLLGNRRVETGAPHASGMIQLAILSDSEFNAYELDLATVRVGEASVATGGNGDYLASYMDRDHDGLKDLLIQVRTNDVGSATEDLPLRVEGRTKEGRLVRAYVQSRSAPALSPQHAEDPVVSAQPLVFDVQFRGPFSTGSGLSMLVSVPAPGDLQIALYDARGRRVHEQEFDRLPSGAHSLTLQMPPTANSGIYFCRARFNEQVVSRKVVLLTR